MRVVYIKTEHACFGIQEALASAPLVGDLAGIKAGEEFSPSSKAEKHAARLHAEAGRLYNEEE